MAARWAAIFFPVSQESGRLTAAALSRLQKNSRPHVMETGNFDQVRLLRLTKKFPAPMGPGILIRFAYFASLYRKVTIWARVQVSSEPKVVALVPAVMPFM